MASELPFKLPVVVIPGRGDRHLVCSYDGHTLGSFDRKSVADAIVAALNGYAAIREALENMPRPSSTGDMTEFGRRVLHWQASVDAALNPPAAKEDRDE